MADDEEVTEKGADYDLLAEVKERFDRAAEAEEAQRKRILAAKTFRSGDQWAPEVRIQRAGGPSLQGVAAQPPRPLITVDRLSQPLQLISNQITSANFGIDVLPNGNGADQETAKIFKGYLRRLQNQARSEDPIGWAGEQAVEGGLGWFRLRTEYVERIPGRSANIDLFDQELRLERIANNLAVFSDPTAVLPTKRDMQWAFVVEDIDRDEFKRRWPKAQAIGVEDFLGTGASGKWADWVQEDTIRIAEYWRILYQYQPYSLLEDGQVVPGKVKGAKAVRNIPVPKIKGTKVYALGELPKEDGDPDLWDWIGTRIPLFPILGQEYNVDGQQILQGLIQAALDPQRMLNYSYSAVVEMFALATKTPWVIAEGQWEGYEQLWAQANTTNFAYLPYKPTALAGAIVPPPQRQVAEPPIQAAVEMVKIFEDAIKSTTAVYDPGLGNISAHEKSGRAILALQQQGEQTQSNFMGHVQRAILDMAQEAVWIIPQITRKGQILQILGIDDAPEQVMVGAAFQKGPNGEPIQAPQELPEELLKAQQGLTKFYDLSAGRYAVTVSIGKSFTTKRQEGAQLLGDFLEKNPQLLQIFGDIFFRDLDMPGADEISERMKKMLPPPLQSSGKPGEITPQQFAQFKQQAQQMIEMLTKELEAKTKIIETEGVKAQQELEKERMKTLGAVREKELDADTRLKIATIQANATIGSAEIKAGMAQMQSQIAAQQALLEQYFGLQHETEQQTRDMGHEAAMASISQDHEAKMAQQQMGHEAGMAGGQQAHEQQMQANAPKPGPQA